MYFKFCELVSLGESEREGLSSAIQTHELKRKVQRGDEPMHQATL